MKVLFDNEKMGSNDNVFGNELMCPIDGESEKNENILNLEDAIDIQQNTEQGTSIQNDGCYHNNQKHPKVKDFVEYKIFGSNYFQKAQIIKRAGKVSGKHSDWYNSKGINDDTISNIDWKSVDKWKLYSQEEALINSLVNNFSDFDITNAKLVELNKWKTHEVYNAVDNCIEKFSDLRWVFSERYVNGELNVKARLVAKGFQEDNSDILSDSPTCSKESMCLVLISLPHLNGYAGP